jgi:hypothetical protein
MRARLIAGSAFGITSPVRTHSLQFDLHSHWQTGRIPLPG